MRNQADIIEDNYNSIPSELSSADNGETIELEEGIFIVESIEPQLVIDREKYPNSKEPAYELMTLTFEDGSELVYDENGYFYSKEELDKLEWVD